MNIVDLYWKWKRAIRKRRESIARVITVSLIVLLVAVIGYATFTIIRDDAHREAIANQDKDKTTIKATKKYDYGEPGFQKVAENDKLILSADFTTAEIEITEKATGMKWYSNPQNRSEDTVAAIKTRLDSQIHVTFLDLAKGVFMDMDNAGGSIKKGRMESQKIENGVKFIFGFPTANVYIPVQYTLTEDGFLAEIVTSEIKGVGSNPYAVETVSLLPYFGAGGVEDEGYLFVPDGSGALINYNNGKHYNQGYSAMVYGNNPTIEKTEAGTVKERISMPVFGAKTNDHAFFGIIVAGEGCSEISATTSKNDSSYNHVYPSAVLREYSILYKKGDSNANKSSYTIDYSDDLMDGANYAVRYFFLEGEKANYVGMSELYRDYLTKNGMLKDSELADKKHTVVDLVGAVSIKKYVMGVKKPVVTALTTYNEVCEIVKELKAQGVENLVINYIGALNSGLNNKTYNTVAPESVLGTKKEFKAMIEFLEKEGVLLFLESNPVDLYEDGNGLTENGESTKTFFDHYAFQYNFELDKGTQIATSRWHLLRPHLLAGVTEGFAKSAADWKVSNVSLARLGEVLYSYYYKDPNYASRTQGLKLWAEAMKAVDDNANYVMMHGGNVYCAPYTDVITDVSDSHSDFDMQDDAIPFYQLTFQSSKLLTSGGINTTVDYEYAFLKALETGSSLKFNLIYGDVSQLVGTDYNTMVSYSYDYWKTTLVEKSLEMQKAIAQFAGQNVIRHEILDEDVTLTSYESGNIIVNYRNEAYTYQGQEIGARDYLVIPGGAK